MTIRIGVNPLSWINSDIPSLGAHIPVEQCIAEAALIGFPGIELEDPIRASLEISPRVLEDRNMQLVAGWHGTFVLENDLRQEKQRLLEHIQLLKRWGGRVVNLSECSYAVHRDPSIPLADRPTLKKVQWNKLCTGLEALDAICRENGMVSAYHRQSLFPLNVWTPSSIRLVNLNLNEIHHLAIPSL